MDFPFEEPTKSDVQHLLRGDLVLSPAVALLVGEHAVLVRRVLASPFASFRSGNEMFVGGVILHVAIAPAAFTVLLLVQPSPPYLGHTDRNGRWLRRSFVLAQEFLVRSHDRPISYNAAPTAF